MSHQGAVVRDRRRAPRLLYKVLLYKERVGSVTAVRTAETGIRRTSPQGRLPSAASDQPTGAVARSGPDRSPAGPLQTARPTAVAGPMEA
jgi:hypothetical protein